MDNIPHLITPEDNMVMSAMPNKEEVEIVVKNMSGDSACGLDGFSGLFYQ